MTMDPLDSASETLQEHAREEAEHASEKVRASRKRRLSAVVIAVLGSAAALCEMSTGEAQNGQLRHNIQSENIWNHYQAKSVRRAVLESEARILSRLPSAGAPADAQVLADRDRALSEAARMASDPAKGDGMEQLSAQAREQEEMRDHDERLHARLEAGTKGIGIAVVFTAMAIGIDSLPVLVAAAVLGAASLAYAALAGLGLL